MLNDELHIAPFEKPPRILDVGTGTGIWAIDNADTYPSAEIVGIDLSPKLLSAPPKCRFEIDDTEQTWTYPKVTSTDLRSSLSVPALPCSFVGKSPNCWYLYGDSSINITPRTTSTLSTPGTSLCRSSIGHAIRTIYKHLKPGGWVEFVEHDIFPCCGDGAYTEETASYKYVTTVATSLQEVGNCVTVAESLKSWAEEARLINVKEVKRKMPNSQWPKDPKMKELGKWILMLMDTGTGGVRVGHNVESPK
ncbi:S-adenosyl-L-methionine-dependent methyltransferase [Kalaharituber pfeilii]|nr:S-adenosyl-L-methionine-dependent methyltransferase [Kalaharituber pfeilii]